MNLEEVKKSKEVLKKIVKEISPEDRAELVRQYREDLIFGKRGRCY